MMDKHAETEDYKELNWEVSYTTFCKLTDRPWGKTTTTFWIDVDVRQGKIIAHVLHASVNICLRWHGLWFELRDLITGLFLTNYKTWQWGVNFTCTWKLNTRRMGKWQHIRTQPQSYLKSADVLHNTQQCQQQKLLFIIICNNKNITVSGCHNCSIAFSTSH